MTFQNPSSPGLTGGPKQSPGDLDRRLDPPAQPSAARGMTRWGAAAAFMLATPALAHEGHHETLTLAEQVRHLLSQPDHQLALAGLVVLAVTSGWFWRRAKAKK
jgi:hypothetical protein